jgi:hypothetical protein
MPLIRLSIEHGGTEAEARRRLEAAVQEVASRFGTWLQRVDWAADRNRVRLEGRGFWVEMWVDTQAVHATGDAAIVGRLLGTPFASGVKRIVERIFRKQLP